MLNIKSYLERVGIWGLMARMQAVESTGESGLAGRLTAVETRAAEVYYRNRLDLPAATGGIAANRLVSITADTVAKFGYASATYTLDLFISNNTEGVAAGATVTGVKWGTRALHTCTATSAAIAIGDIVMIAANGTVVKATQTGGECWIGTAKTAVDGAGGARNISIAPLGCGVLYIAGS